MWTLGEVIYNGTLPVVRCEVRIGHRLLNDRVLPFYESQSLPMLRILTDRGTEFCGKVEQHDDPLYLAINDIDPTKTKAMSSQTNSIRERFHKMILNEFYQITLRKQLENLFTPADSQSNLTNLGE